MSSEVPDDGIERVDEQYGFVRNMTVDAQASFDSTTRIFFCLLKENPIIFDDDPAETGQLGEQSAEPFHTRFARLSQSLRSGDDGPTCAIVSHSSDFVNMSKTHSFSDEIDAHGVVIRFNDHNILSGTRGCRTDFRLLNNQYLRKKFLSYFTSRRGILKHGLRYEGVHRDLPFIGQIRKCKTPLNPSCDLPFLSEFTSFKDTQTTPFSDANMMYLGLG